MTIASHHCQENLATPQGVAHPVVVVKDGCRYWGTHDLTLTAQAVKAHYPSRQQLAETFRLLKQELG